MGRNKISDKRRKEVIERDNCTCQICGIKVDINSFNKDNSLNIDHILPISKGGKNNIDNLRVLCRKCNLSRRNVSLDEYRETLINKAHIDIPNTRLKCMIKDYSKESVLKILDELKLEFEKHINEIQKNVENEVI